MGPKFNFSAPSRCRLTSHAIIGKPDFSHLADLPELAQNRSENPEEDDLPLVPGRRLQTAAPWFRGSFLRRKDWFLRFFAKGEALEEADCFCRICEGFCQRQLGVSYEYRTNHEDKCVACAVARVPAGQGV
jgi:hypothetical protein